MTFKREGPGVKNVVAALDGLEGVEGKVGWFETAHYATGQPVAYIASIHEFGYAAGNIPARPFMRPTVTEKGADWVKLLGQGAKAVMNGGGSARDVLEMVMLKAAGDVAKKIAAGPFAPLSPVTVARKGSDKPLIETGQLIQSVTGKVE